MMDVERTIGYLQQLHQGDGEPPWIAYLSVDGDGLPVEFLHGDVQALSSSVRAFYGDSLDRHVLKESIRSIARALERAPQLVLCHDPELARMAQLELPIVLVSPISGLPPEGSGPAMTAAFADLWPLLKDLHETCEWNLYEPFERFERIRQELMSAS